MYSYRELIWSLAISDLKTKYANSVLGFAWSMINPMVMFIVFFLVFSNSYRDVGNYASYLLVGIVSWRFFQNGVAYTMGSIVANHNIVTRIALPKEALPLSTALSNTISSLFEFALLLALLFVSGNGLGITALFFPVILALNFLIVYGLGLLLSALYVYFRDLGRIWEVAAMAGFFLSPVVYPLSIIPVQYQPVYLLNPMTALIGMYRDILVYGTVPGLYDLALVIAFGVALVMIGSFSFSRRSKRFAEVM